MGKPVSNPGHAFSCRKLHFTPHHRNQLWTNSISLCKTWSQGAMLHHIALHPPFQSCACQVAQHHLRVPFNPSMHSHHNVGHSPCRRLATFHTFNTFPKVVQQQLESASNLLHCDTPLHMRQPQPFVLRTHDYSLYVIALQHFTPFSTLVRSCSSTWRVPPTRYTAMHPSTCCWRHMAATLRTTCRSWKHSLRCERCGGRVGSVGSVAW